jgi:5'-nucleotidase
MRRMSTVAILIAAAVMIASPRVWAQAPAEQTQAAQTQAEQTQAAQTPTSQAVVTIVHLNDIYEIQPVEGGKFGGPARVATVIANLKKTQAALLTTLGGDYLSPSALGTARIDGKPIAGRQMVDVLNLMGLDWATFGNHEFDVSEEAFRANLAAGTFKIVSSNVSAADGQPFPGVPRSAIVPLTVGARVIRLGLIGVTIDSTPKPWVRYRDPIVAAREEIAKLRGQVDAIVALTHLSVSDDASFVVALPEVDLVLGGHEHENWDIRRGAGFTPIIKADANVRSVAIVTMTFGAAATRPTVASHLQIIDASIPAWPSVEALAQRWTNVAFDGFRKDGFSPEVAVVTTDIALDGREATVRNRSGRLTDLIAAGLAREAGGVDVALMNGGSIRIDDVIPAGPITEYDIIRVLPFGGKVAKATFDGALLAKVLDTGLANKGVGGYLHTMGVTGTSGAWLVKGKAIDPAARYTVALPEFLLTGGEMNMGYLTRTNPGVRDVVELRDIRRVVIDELKATYR